MEMPPQPKKPSALKKTCAKIGAKLTAAYRRVLVYLTENPISISKASKLSTFDQLAQANHQPGACFGAALSDLMGQDGLPVFTQDAFQVILSQKSTKKLKRMFSDSADWKRVQKIINVYNSGNPSVSERKIVTKGQIEAVGSALLYFLKQLPMPLCHDCIFFTASDRIMFTYACKFFLLNLFCK